MEKKDASAEAEALVRIAAERVERNRYLNSVYSDIYPAGSEYWTTEERQRWRVKMKNLRNKDKIKEATKRALQNPETRQRRREMVSARWYIRGYIPDEIVRDLLFGDFVGDEERTECDSSPLEEKPAQTPESESPESSQ